MWPSRFNLDDESEKYFCSVNLITLLTNIESRAPNSTSGKTISIKKTLRCDSLWMRGNEERGNVSLVTPALRPEMIFILPQLQIFTSTIST